MDKKSAFFIILSIVILAVMLYFVGIDKIIETLKNANPALIALAIGVQIFTYLLYNLRWKWIINITDIKVSFAQLLPSYSLLLPDAYMAFNHSYFGGDCNRCNPGHSNLLMYQSEFRIQD